MKEKSEVSGCPGHPVTAMDIISDDEQWSDSWSAHQIREWQMADPVLSKVLAWVEAGVKPPQRVVRKEGATTHIYWSLFEQLDLKDGVLYRIPETTEKQTNLKLVAPLDVQDHIFKCLHSSHTTLVSSAIRYLLLVTLIQEHCRYISVNGSHRTMSKYCSHFLEMECSGELSLILEDSEVQGFSINTM